MVDVGRIAQKIKGGGGHSSAAGCTLQLPIVRRLRLCLPLSNRSFIEGFASDGFLFIDKPRGLSSFAVVSAVRQAYHVKRVGHGGTLDPAASGLLVVALGTATCLLRYAPLEPKRYFFGIRFGEETDTLDAVGTVIKTGGSIPSAPALMAVLPVFCGSLLQVPPAYSAVKIDGVRAYRMARAGRVPIIQPRFIEVHSLHLVKYDDLSGEAELELNCSGGTYVRSLSRDIAAALGTWGHVFFVRRIALGPFHVDNAARFDKCDVEGTQIVPSGDVLRAMPSIEVGEEQKQRIIAGRNLSFAEVLGAGAPPDGPALAIDRDNNIVAILEPRTEGHFHPVRVLIAQSGQRSTA